MRRLHGQQRVCNEKIRFRPGEDFFVEQRGQRDTANSPRRLLKKCRRVMACRWRCCSIENKFVTNCCALPTFVIVSSRFSSTFATTVQAANFSMFIFLGGAPSSPNARMLRGLGIFLESRQFLFVKLDETFGSSGLRPASPHRVEIRKQPSMKRFPSIHSSAPCQRAGGFHKRRVVQSRQRLQRRVGALTSRAD